MKRTFAVVLALFLTMSMLLAGCATSTPAATTETAEATTETAVATTETGAAPSGEVVWWGWTPGSPINEQYIAAFNEVYPDIKVTWKQATVADYDAVLKPALSAGEGVDAFEVSAGSANGGIAIFGGQAVDLTDAVKAALGDDWQSKLTESSIKNMTVDGQLKGLGVGAVYSGNLWINQDLFDKYNVTIPTNMAEWKTACEIFKANGIIGFVQGAGMGAFNMDTYHAICDNVAPGMFTKACRGEVAWTDPALVKGLELWKSLFDEGIMQDGAMGLMQYPEANNLFMSQQAAMVMMGSWYTMNTLPDTMKAAMESASSTAEPFTMIPINFPDLAGTGNVGSMFGDLDYGTAVAANSKNIDAAIAFAVWLCTSPEGTSTIANSLNVVPSLKSAAPDWSVVKLVNPEKQEAAIKAYLQNASASGDNPRFADINADLNQAMMDVLAGVATGTLTPDEGAAQLQQAYEDSM